ncbi:putative membrane protein, contains type II SA sequence [Handroanthus impetiginosus]|uniref:Putative membrane protein, contains type II SA sequence n=1 Tax=Handroanthus impetiginosus TaxID=429701 RepID=A0A2G9GIY9_9LAMI|nr:putative membrane protein, contains type II SA sequence [Handroanthus impetiginosus]
MAKSNLSLIFLLVVVVIFAVSAYGIDDKCAACNAIAEELERGLLNEKPRNHLDMRHRLDSKGQREGKLIDYRVSELRVVELLDGLCEKMQDYTLEKVDSSRRVWVKVNNWDNLRTDKQEARAYAKDISTFCGRLLEATEDQLSESIKKGFVKVGEVRKVLCHDLGRYCSQTREKNRFSDNQKAIDDEDTSDGEL